MKPLLFLFAFVLTGSTVLAADAVTGTVTLPSQAVVSPGTALEIAVLDDFAADAPNVIAHTEIPAAAGRLPFSLKLDPQRIQGNHPYRITAYVRSPTGLFFTADKKYPVLTQGGSGRADIVLVAVPASFQNKPYGPALEDTYWKLMSLGTTRAPATAGREPYLRLYAFASHVSASGGCNILRGSYAAKDQALSFTEMTSTRMSCPTGTNVDADLLKALTETQKSKVTGDQMNLLDADGATLASFRAIPPR